MTVQITPEQNNVWVLRTTKTEAAQSSAGRNATVPPFRLDFDFTSRFIAVGLKVIPSGQSWRFGGLISQEFDFDSTDYATEGKAFYQAKELLINQVTILEVPVITTAPYKLWVFPPSWFRRVEITVWEYTGDVSDEVVTAFPGLNQIQEDVAEIKSSLPHLVTLGKLEESLQSLDCTVDLSALERIEALILETKAELCEKIEAIEGGGNLGGSGSNFPFTGAGSFEPQNPQQNLGFGYFQGLL